MERSTSRSKAFDETGEWLPQETLDTIKEYLIAIKGPLTTNWWWYSFIKCCITSRIRPIYMFTSSSLVQRCPFTS